MSPMPPVPSTSQPRQASVDCGADAANGTNQAPVPLLALLQERLEPLRELCERYGVEKLELFGSAAKGTFGPASSAINLIAAFRNRRQGDYAQAILGHLAHEPTLSARCLVERLRLS